MTRGFETQSPRFGKRKVFTAFAIALAGGRKKGIFTGREPA